jgi:anti-sigma B factor antagonist
VLPRSRYFDVRIDRDPDQVVLQLTGELDLAALSQISQAFAQAEAHGVGLLVVDLDGLTYIDSSGVGALLAAQQRAQANAHRISIANPRGAVARVFALMDLGRHLPLADPSPA